MKKQQNIRKELAVKGHGTYTEIFGEKEFFDVNKTGIFYFKLSN